MKNREDFLKLLRDNPRYREALGAARTDKERQAIIALVEGFVGDAGAILGPAIEQAKKDPQFAARLGRALLDGKDVLSNSEPATSGSNG